MSAPQDPAAPEASASPFPTANPQPALSLTSQNQGSATPSQHNGDTGTPTPALTNPENAPPSDVTDEEWRAMQTLLNNIYQYRTADGDDPSKLFHRMVNRRAVPDYYDVISEPMAMSQIKKKINGHEYKNFPEFVRDWALITHNAQLYNVPHSQAYVDALLIKEIVEKQLEKLVQQGVVAKDKTAWPFLGEIPPADEMQIDRDEDQPEDEEEEEEDDDEEEEDDEEDSDDEPKPKRRRGRTSTAAKRGDGKETAERKRRGRPPRVDTPMEARMKSIMKGLRRSKNDNGELMISSFETLPSKEELPQYYSIIRDPMDLAMIKRKMKRKKYSTLEQFMYDVNLMFDNAKLYNEEGSQIYQEALTLHQEAVDLAKHEKQRPDSDFTMEDGRIPLADILHHGEVWRVGDWVHIQNANDLTKPIVAQLYRTWQDQDGNKWVNACWYYRPEQTVHRYDRHFYENEVVKTGQYRDHPIDEVIDRCFVMFITRYYRGRPKGFPPNKEVYVCECRYNEEKHKLNKIKTWASCLPDEVRDKDYEMDKFNPPRKVKKVPSPIKYLFQEAVQKETDPLPQPTWGAANAPPRIGAVHCLPRDPKDSPPPEPTPSPPPQQPITTTRQMASQPPNGYDDTRRHNANFATASPSNPALALAPTQTMAPTTAYSSAHHSHSGYHGSPSPAPSHGQMPAGNNYTQLQPSYQPSQHAQNASHNQHQNHAASNRSQQGPTAGAYLEPKPIEVYRLPQAANDTLLPHVREQFQVDAEGRILFFTNPPKPEAQSARKHTSEYIEWRKKRIAQMKAKLVKDKVEGESPEMESLAAEEPGKIPSPAQPINMSLPHSQRVHPILGPMVPTYESLGLDPAAPGSELALAKAWVEWARRPQGAHDELSIDLKQVAFWIIQSNVSKETREALDVDLIKDQEVVMRVLGHIDRAIEANKVWEAREEKQKKLAMDNELKRKRVAGQIHGLTQSLDYRPPNEHLEWPGR